MMSSGDYQIRKPEVNERSKLLDFLVQYFYPNEYLLDAYLTCNKDKIDYKERKEFQDFFKKRYEIMLEYSPSLIAVKQETGEIAGLCIFWLQRNPGIDINQKDPDDTDVQEKLAAVPKRSINLQRWFDYVLDVTEDFESLFKEYPCEKYALDIIIVGVHPNHTCKGLATRLISEAVEWAKKKHVGIISGLFTSPYSIRAANKIDFKTDTDFNVSELKDADGNFMYPGIEPYVVSYMVKVC